MLTSLPTSPPLTQKVHSSHGVQDNFLPGPQTRIYVPSDLSQASVPNFSMKYFFCIQCFLLYMCLHFICCSFGQRQHSPFSLSRSLLLSLFFAAWMYDPAHRLNHLRNFFRHTVCYFSLSTYSMNYLAPMNMSSTKLQLIYLTAFLREYEVT